MPRFGRHVWFGKDVKEVCWCVQRRFTITGLMQLRNIKDKNVMFLSTGAIYCGDMNSALCRHASGYAHRCPHKRVLSIATAPESTPC